MREDGADRISGGSPLADLNVMGEKAILRLCRKDEVLLDVFSTIDGRGAPPGPWPQSV